jgi:uncharacterized OsmC-like protein
MTGTFGGALSARNIHVGTEKLSADVVGEVELDENVLVIRRIKVHFSLRAPEAMRPAVERAHSVFADRCPLYRTFKHAIEITSSFDLVS